MNSESLAWWEKARARGKAHFILMRGVVGYGAPMFIVMTFISHRQDLSTRFVGTSAVVWLIAGAAFGAILWHYFERQRVKASQKNGA
jgi:hypothetical protein